MAFQPVCVAALALNDGYAVEPDERGLFGHLQHLAGQRTSMTFRRRLDFGEVVNVAIERRACERVVDARRGCRLVPQCPGDQLRRRTARRLPPGLRIEQTPAGTGVVASLRFLRVTSWVNKSRSVIYRQWVMVAVPVDMVSVAPLGSVSFSRKFRLPAAERSASSETNTVFVVSPGLNVRLPVLAT